ncbi:hypothetical protein [Streptomyces kebangsaanensis]|uniref:hypothetical protein n=1 Tax=Streptomyces kebangsaanensis TaxID=864058 RepID=UPI00093B537A|nr:hypothetical protein [Streptomyces kebangsaanensis]
MHHAPRGAPSRPLVLLSAVLLALLALFTGSPSPYPAAVVSAAHGVTDGLPAPAHTDHHPGAPTAPDHRAPRHPGPVDTGGDTGRGDPPGGAPRADDQCGAVCSTQSGTRQEAHGERPPQHAQPVTAVQEAMVAAPPSRRVAPVGGYVPCPVGHVVRVGGRAPPGGQVLSSHCRRPPGGR